MCLTLGSGDSDSFGFDANTARPTSYNASVNGVSKSTMITNNTNRTIRQVAVTNGLYSGGSQTCTSGYDDLGRLGYSNCLPLWFASYSYDPFGNIDKSDQGYSGTSFLPTYNQATNRLQTLPAPPQPTYDGNGNLTYDGFHSYTWDAEGNMLSIDGSARSTFDAFNRRVEYGSGSSYTQLLYPPFDETYQLGTWGATPSVRFPLPGGGQAIFGSSGLNNYRHPNWQGSQTLASSPTRTLLVDNAFTPFGEKYAEYNGGYNGYFADMLAIGPNGLIADGYQSETRMLHGSQGRWVSADPAGLGAVDPTNPQTWNRYAYVGNDPLNNSDPSGMCSYGDPTCFAVTVIGCRWNIFCWSGNGTSPLPPVGYQASNGGVNPNTPGGPQFTGTGAGGASSPANTGLGAADIARCAASHASSIASVLHFSQDNLVAQTFLGNDFAPVTSIALGPDRSTNLAGALVSNPLPLNATSVVAGKVGNIRVPTAGLAVQETPGGAAYAVTKFLPLAATTGGKLAAKLFVVFSAVKLAYDGVSFGAAELQCAGVTH